MIAKLRSEKGRWVDYIIEFARAIDNLVGYHKELAKFSRPGNDGFLSRLDFYFDIFLQAEKDVSVASYVKEIERYNTLMKENPKEAENQYIESVQTKYAEFESLYGRYKKRRKQVVNQDIFQFLMENSEFLNKEENKWMLMVMEAVRTTSLYFQPQIRTKILNEGWASYWHEELFLKDDRINGHEIDFAIVNAKVTSMPRVGLNPYALGMRLFTYIEELGDKGRISRDFRYLKEKELRDKFDTETGGGRDYIFLVRENCSDSMFINSFIDQDFVDQHKLFVTVKG